MIGEQVKVLIVEDDAAHAELVVDAFDEERGNFDVIVKDNLKGAMAQIESSCPDIVVADINLPDGKGSDLVPHRNAAASFPVIVMTSFGNEELAVETMKLGVMDYVVKSEHSFASLPHIVSRALAEWRANVLKREAEANASRLAAAVNQAGESIMMTDDRSIITYVNPFFEEMTGYSIAEVIGQKASVLSSGKQDKKFYENLHNTISSGETWKGFFTNRKKDGSFFDEEAVISPVFDEAGVIISYVAVKRDVTNERMLERQVRQSQKMAAIGQLAQKVAHDFTNVLSVILGNCRLAKMKIDEGDELCQYIDDVISSADNISKLTSELIAFAHPSDLRLRPVRLDRVISGVEKMLQKALPVDVETILEFDKEALKANLDQSQIEQVIIHMAINAAESMPKGGKLTISTIPDTEHPPADGFVTMTISDTGCGMSDEVQQHIFEPFYTTKQKGTNSGLGLSTVYRIIEQHGGSIIVESVLGEGTEVTVSVPIAD